MVQGQLRRMKGGTVEQRALGFVGLEMVARFEGREQQRVSAVDGIPDDGQAVVLQVDANLVSAPEQRLAAQQRAAGKFFHQLDARAGLPPLAEVEIALIRAARVLPVAAERLAVFVLAALDREATDRAVRL